MKYLILLLSVLFLAISGKAQELPEPMVPKRMVNDFAGLLSAPQANALERTLRNFNDTSSTQIAVATVSSLNGYDPNDYAQRLAQKWGIGQKGKDNGILILVKPKTNREKGQTAIAVGYGLEGVVPDAIASRIVRNEMIPEFQKGDYYQGIQNASKVLMQLSGGEYTAEEYSKKHEEGRAWPILLPFFLIFILPLFFRRRRGYTTGSHGAGGVPPIFFGGLGRGSSFGSFSGGGGSFGGFGGGGFGGGGASGSW